MNDTCTLLFHDFRDSYAIQDLTNWLRGKLRGVKQVEKQWKGRVLLFNKNIFIYNVFTTSKEFDIYTTYVVYTLRDGNFMVQQKDNTNEEYSSKGTLLDKIDIAGSMQLELTNGTVIFSGNNKSKTYLYNRKTGGIVCYDDEVSRIIQLLDGRLVSTTYSHNNITIRNTLFNIIKEIDLSQQVGNFIEYKPGILLCCGVDCVIQVNIETGEQKQLGNKNWSDILLLKNGSVALISSRELQIMENGHFSKSFDIEMEYIEQHFAQVRDNVVAYSDSGYKNICLHDCVTGQLTKYPLPNENHYTLFVSFIFE
jgi:hypothetical protein